MHRRQKKTLYILLLIGGIIFSLFLLLKLIANRQVSINRAQTKKSAATTKNPYARRTTFDRYTEHEELRRRLGDPPRLPRDKIQKIIDQAKTSQDGIGQDAPITKHVMVLVYDPIMPNHAGVRLHDLYRWHDPEVLAQEYIDDIRLASHGYINYRIDETKIMDSFPEKIDGFVYNEQSYLDCAPLPTHGPAPTGDPHALCHQPDESDYYQLLTEHNVCQKVNNGEIDELWLFGGPFFGFWEAAMAGPLSHDTNGGIYRYDTDCTKNLYMMGFNYETSEVNMLHDFVHRTEGSMTYVYGSWKNNPYDYVYRSVTDAPTPTTAPSPYTHWEDYSASALVPSTIPGLGVAHYPPNSTDYRRSEADFTNPRTVQSTANDWLRYPNTQGSTTSVSSINWENSEHGFYLWFLSHLPHVSGKNTDNTFNNWWKYLIAMSDHFPDPSCDPPLTTPLSPANNGFDAGIDYGTIRLVTLKAQTIYNSCINRSYAGIYARDVTENELFKEVCNNDDHQEPTLECNLEIVPDHRYEWKVIINNFSRYTQSPIQQFTSTPPPCDPPSISLWFPLTNTVFSLNTADVTLSADVIFNTCNNTREREIFIRDVSQGQDFHPLCFYREDTTDLRFSCGQDVQNNHYYEWYATAFNGTHRVQTPHWRFAVGSALPTYTPTPTFTPTPTRTPTPTPWYNCDTEDLSACSCANADINRDCKVDVFDLTKGAACYNLPPSDLFCGESDVIPNGHVQINDLCCISTCYGQKCPF